MVPRSASASGVPSLLQVLVHRGVHAAHEEGRHRSHALRLEIALQPADIRVGHRLVVCQREHQRNVDVDAFGDQGENRRNAFRRAGNLDQQVGTVHGVPQPPRLGNAAGRVLGKPGRNLDAHETVRAFGAVVHRAQDVGRGLDVRDLDGVEQRHRRHVRVGGEQVLELFVVVGAAGNGLVKNRGIAGKPAEPVLFHQPLQLSRSDQVAADVVQPDGLPMGMQFQQKIPGRMCSDVPQACSSFRLLFLSFVGGGGRVSFLDGADLSQAANVPRFPG